MVLQALRSLDVLIDVVDKVDDAAETPAAAPESPSLESGVCVTGPPYAVALDVGRPLLLPVGVPAARLGQGPR